MNIRPLVRKINFRPFKSPDEFWRKRVRFGQINEMVGRLIISSDGNGYTLPFLCNPFRESWEKEKHLNEDEEFGKKMLTAYEYELATENQRETARKAFDIAYDLVKDRIGKDDVIFDVGCSSGHHLQSFYKKGHQNLWGIDPVSATIEYGRELRPYINFRTGFFGPPENDVICDLMTWFGVISRIPYSAKLFKVIDRCVTKYVLIANVQEAADDFIRDYHYEMGKIGFICIEKRVLTGEETPFDGTVEFLPIGTPGADGPLLELGNRKTGKDLRRLFRSFFLFRRIEPRPPAPRDQH